MKLSELIKRQILHGGIDSTCNRYEVMKATVETMTLSCEDEKSASCLSDVVGVLDAIILEIKGGAC